MRSFARRGLMLAALLALVAAALAYAARESGLPERSPNARPTLLLLTSLPIVFGEDFALESGGSPALTELEKRYRVVPISIADTPDLSKGRLLLMAHPRAQPPENLVLLDEWVRQGGHVLLLADPMLEWPSERPPGDRLRPAPMFADTGLLAHWGLRLDAPAQRAKQRRSLGGYDVLTDSPGELFGSCAIRKDRLVAHCRIGKGRATVVADADLLGVDHLDNRASRNLDGLLAELAQLERP